MIERDSLLLHPFLAPGAKPDVRLVRGNGSIVSDDRGRSYIDAASGLWNLSLGLGQGRILAAMQRQAEELAFCGLFDSRHGPAEQLAHYMCEASGGHFAAAYFSTTGTSAVECALRVARVYHRAKGRSGRRKILSFADAYHGCSWMNLSASGSMTSEMAGWEEPLEGFEAIPGPLDEAASLAGLNAAIAASPDAIACLLIEPISGTGGMVVPSREYMEEIGRICRAADILVIADEVATGCGRTGTMFASFALGLQPDLITLSKGLTAGYFPLGATLFRRSTIEPLRGVGAPILFGSTQDGNPIGCAVALEVLDMIHGERLLNRAEEVGGWFRDGLAPLVGFGALAEIRGMGAMLGLALVHPHNGAPYSEQEALAVRRQCREEGLLVYHFASGVSLFPALTMTREEADDAVDILFTILSSLS